MNIKDQFAATLHARVEDYFKVNRMSKYGGIEIYFKSILIIGMFISAYLILLLNQNSMIVLWILFLILGFCHVLISVNISHDAIHGCYTRKKWLNKLAELTFNLIGVSSYMYKKKHLITHTDSQYAEKRSSIQKQSFLMKYKSKEGEPKNVPIILYFFFSFYMILVRDFMLFAKDEDRIPSGEYIFLFFSKGLYIALFLILPYFFIHNPWWQILIGQLLLYSIVTISIIVILLMPTEGIEQPKIASYKETQNEWAIEILKYNIDFGPDNKFINLLFGGNNMNVIHYLFPDISHVHYVHLSKIVKNTVGEFGLIYRENTFFKVFGLPVKYFRQLHENEKRDLAKPFGQTKIQSN